MKNKQFLLDNNIITDKGKLNNQLTRWPKYKWAIDWLFQNKPFETKNIGEIVYALYHNIFYKPFCPICKSKELKFDKFTTGYQKYCSHRCYSKDLCNYIHWTEISDNKKKKEVFEKIVNTKRKNGSYIVSEETKEKQSLSAKKSMNKKRKTNLKKYGVENPGVFGGNSSKSALTFIKKFIKDNNINDKLCFYHDSDNGKEEFFQMINVPFKEKKKYAKYDLVVFKSKRGFENRDIMDIDIILEYNGPWHYPLKKVLADPYGPSTPYSNNKLSKKQSYQYDIHKRLHFKHVKNYYVYWEKWDIMTNGNLLVFANNIL